MHHGHVAPAESPILVKNNAVQVLDDVDIIIRVGFLTRIQLRAAAVSIWRAALDLVLDVAHTIPVDGMPVQGEFSRPAEGAAKVRSLASCTVLKASLGKVGIDKIALQIHVHRVVGRIAVTGGRREGGGRCRARVPG